MITTIIESYLRAIDQATFQKLMNHILILEGYSFIASPVATIDRNKIRPEGRQIASFFMIESGRGLEF